MKKNIIVLTLSLLLFPIFLFGQNRISIDLIGSIDNSFRSLSPEDNLIVGLRNEYEVKKIGFRYGANFNIYFGDLGESYKAALKTGVRYINIGYESTLADVDWSFRYIEIPLALRYYYGDRKIQLYTELGLSANIHTKGVYDDLVQQRKWNYAAMVSFGLDFNLSSEIAFFLQPIFRYHLSDSYVDHDYKENLYNTGLEVGLRVKL